MPSIRIVDFDTWKEGYADATVSIKVAGTNTLASVWTDEALTTAADNPQTLISRQIGDRLFGKFEASIYTGQPYYLDIDSTDTTAIVRPPLVSLEDEDASLATVRATGGSQDITFADTVARITNVENYGEFLPTSDGDASAATNNQTLEDAISAVSSGGFVILPRGTFAIEELELPGGVVICGQGRDVTILQSQTAAEVFTLGGDDAGFRDLTIDGVSLEADSAGVFAAAKSNIILDRVTIKRFSVGIYCKGGNSSRWNDLIIDGCTTNAQLHGDTSDSGTAFRDNRWTGKCINSVTIGIDLRYVDAIVAHNSFCVGFEDNAATAVQIRGARYSDFSGSWWSNNDTNMDVDDFVTGSFEDDNTILGLWVEDFRMDGGSLAFEGECDDVVFERGLMAGVAIALTIPDNAILARDVVEDSDVAITGDGTKWTRWKSIDHGASSGITTNNSATKAWAIHLDPGQRAFLVGTVIGNAKTSDESAEYYIAVSARRPPSTLAYDGQTGNFTMGLTITGSVSGATALAVSDSDSGATGTLEVRDIVGAFVDNETITDTSTGSATVNGSLSEVNAELLGSVTALRTAREDDSDWNATFVANGPEVECRVQGDTSKTVEWTVHVDVVKT